MPWASDNPVSGLLSWYFSDDGAGLRTRTVLLDVAASAHSPGWIAVIATVLTMSPTSAPRDRSLTGLLSPPQRTGPIAHHRSCAAPLVGVVVR